ncbi:uncharacterized protein Syx5 isoform X1 [Tribolium castaneum]|uniref:uncharacterized protein Syx5 isoform X1 n=1 Tax=Tribolium castaneum TaxID=7070 RepID=UPI0001C0C48A|nr:PREDICTED: uncharacterized protein LOC664217 isoform X1 [Tribolium castaneum]|eukprot:XP_015834457.1 PREDICTED: uncharacterized protein LOC664217 isoform X1 [Tribolium castaneum]
MLPRRRRAGSETEPLVVTSDNHWTKESNLNYINSAYPNNVSQDYYLEDDFQTEEYIEPEPVMAARDRTSEFINTIQTLQGRSIQRAVAVRDPKKSKAIQIHSEFMLIAKNIGRNIASTYTKLEKLTLFAMASYDIKNLEDVLNPVIKKSDFVSASVSRLTSAGDNYASLILAVDITVKGQNNKIRTVAKLLPRNPYVQKHFNSQCSFRNEVGYYQTIIPCLKQFQREQGISEVINCVPDFFGARFNLHPPSTKIDENAILLIKNIQDEGFVIIDRKIGFDANQTRLILSKLSQLHATALALQIHKPEIFATKIRPFLEEFTAFDVGEEDSNRTQESLFDFIKDDAIFAEHLPRIRHILKANADFVIHRNNRNLKPSRFVTVSHGDLWVNNVMVKMENGKTVDVKFVDFQMYEHTTLAKDVIFFLFTSVELSAIETNLDAFLWWYYESFLRNLESLKCDVSEYTFEGFLDEIGYILRTTELLHVLLMLRPIYADGSIKETEELKKEDFVRYGFVPPKGCKEKARYVVRECIRRGWI